ncbi:MAG TPA: hypothetical protein VI386_39190, partial [Candidatus Sulfotelmatobacter sp.]
MAGFRQELSEWQRHLMEPVLPASGLRGEQCAVASGFAGCGVFEELYTGMASQPSTLTGGYLASPIAALQIYLDGNGNALELGVDNSEATAGPSYLQTATSSDFEGSYALAGQGF